jgi:hypothetical protein
LPLVAFGIGIGRFSNLTWKDGGIELKDDPRQRAAEAAVTRLSPSEIEESVRRTSTEEAERLQAVRM